MSTGIAYLNDRDVETDFSFHVMAMQGWPGNLGSAPRDVALLEGPEMSGGLIDPRLLRQRAGRATLVGRVDTSTVAGTLAAIDALRAVLSEGEIRVRTAFAPDRYCLATLETHDGDLYIAEMLNGQARVTLTFTVKDGVAWRNVPDGYGLSTARVTTPIGTWKTYPDILIHGGGGTLANPTVKVRNSAGDIVQTMGFSTATLGGGVLGASDFLFIDCSRATVTKSLAGVQSDAISLWNAGDFPVLKPSDGWVEIAAYPSMELSATAGTPQGFVSYRRRYR
jgi:phage-related protein